MAKIPPSMVADPPPSRPSWLRRSRPILLGLLLSPVIYEGTALCINRWRAIAGERVETRTPALDACNAMLDRVTQTIQPWVSRLFCDTSWSPTSVLVAGLVLIASLFGFGRTDAKTADHYFTGFPSYWNIVVFYLYVLEWPGWASALLLTVFAVGVFVPVRYVYPSRTTKLMPLTVGLGAAWALTMLWAIAHLEPRPKAIVGASLAYVVYYFALSFVLARRRAPSPVS